MEGQIEMGADGLKISKLESAFAEYSMFNNKLTVILSDDIETATSSWTMSIEEWEKLIDELPSVIRILAETKW